MNFVDYLFPASNLNDKNVIAGNKATISYKDLYQKINQIACFLKDEIGDQKKVIIISDNSVFFVAAYFGIIKSGNIAVPINPTITISGLTRIIEQCHAKLVFVERLSFEKFKILDIRKLDESHLENLGDYQRELKHLDFDGKRIAEILFTSGSTAIAKGVMLSHNNLIANTDSIVEYLKLSDRDRIEVVLPFYYCYGLSLLHTHIKVGASLVLNNLFFMLNTVIDDLLRYECTGFAGVPSHFQILLRKAKRFKTTQFPSLRYVTQAGGKLPNVFIQEFIESFPETQFYVMYGQTEATARLSYLPAELARKKIGSIGKAIPGVKLEIVDKHGNPVKPGETGELIASGENIMVGYFEDAKLTSTTIRNGNLYTGDIGKMDEDGFIYIVARDKEFLKVAGERISPKEIEEVIVSIPDVIDCSIIGVVDDTLGEAIKAYLVVNKQSTVTVESIREFCYDRLSSTKVPKFIEFIDKIPVNATGKKVKEELNKLNKHSTN